MAGRGSAPGERRGGRERGTPNKPTFNLRAVGSPGEITPLSFMIDILNDRNAPDKDRRWAARTAMPYCHHRLRPALSAIAAGAGKVTVEIRRFTDEEALIELDKIGRVKPGGRAPAELGENTTEQVQPVAQVQPVETAMDRMEADWFNPDSRRVAHEPALPPQISAPAPMPAPLPTPPPPQPPAPAVVAVPVPHETRPIHRANGNGANTTQPQRVNGHPRRVNGAVVRRSDDEIRNISDRRPMPSGYPRTRPVHGVV